MLIGGATHLVRLGRRTTSARRWAARAWTGERGRRGRRAAGLALGRAHVLADVAVVLLEAQRLHALLLGLLAELLLTGLELLMCLTVLARTTPSLLALPLESGTFSDSFSNPLRMASRRLRSDSMWFCFFCSADKRVFSAGDDMIAVKLRCGRR